ncbi:MAG TPA: RidA family protein [Candidatus Baltobacteraceae bacterium]|jgi:enamine deaminase RidA (YjgF/YER057c/UK114 family)|nr:RidA family protein [Candidatus Baltobacteraceae bacterium]
MIERIEPGPRMSKAVVHNGTVYTAGQVAGDTSADAAGQTQQILAKIDGILAAAGSDKSRVLYATVWLADIASYDAMNAVWDAWIAPGNAPARATAEARLAGPQYAVEIAVIAAK